MAEHSQTRISQLEAELALARAAAEARETFLATMSHEIREPMNVILGMARILQENPLDDDQQRHVDAIVDSGENLLTIINDILDISKVDAGKFELSPMNVDTKQFFVRLETGLKVRAAGKALDFVISISDDVPAVIHVDPGRLRQILTNLCGNSIKFTSVGSVRVNVGASTEGDGSVHLRMSVQDTGPGIPMSLHDKMFTAFSQADATIPRLYGGSGLGLMISQKLVHAMGGKIELAQTSEVEGARFDIELFLKPACRTDAEKHRATVISGSKVLVIDPEKRTSVDVEILLGGWKVDVLSVPSIEQGASILRQAVDQGHPFDTVLIDSHSQTRSALELVECIRADMRLSSMSVVLAAASGLRGDAALAAGAGADAYLRKPFEPQSLLRCLQGLPMWDRRKNGIMTIHNLQDRKSRSLKVLVVDDNDLNCKLVRILLERAGHEVSMAENGAQALDAFDRDLPDLVLMDIQMPVMNGIDATRAIRASDDRAKASVPIIAITANAMSGYDKTCHEAGMDDYITKPITGPNLLAAIDRCDRV